MAAMAAGWGWPRAAVAEGDVAGQFLRAEKARRRLLDVESPPTDVLQFATAGKLPILYAVQGQRFDLRVSNTLDEEIWLHFFGVRGTAEVMTFPIQPGPGAASDVSFTPPDAGTFWFAPLLNASRQRDMGLYGMLIVREAAPAAAFTDIPLIIDDWMVDEQGVLDRNFGNLEAAIGAGRLGNWFTVNNAFKFRGDLDRAANNRLRLLNACNTRTLKLQLKNIDVIVIAEDGQPVKPRPLPFETVTLAPGQRIDLLVANSLDQAVIALDLAEDVVEIGFLIATGEAGEGIADNFALPPNPLPVADMAMARTVPLVLAGGAKGGLQSARVGEQEYDLRKLLENGLAWAINGIAGLGGPMLFEARKGETLILAIDNRTSFPQPLHIHGHVWKMIEQDGQAIADDGWRDTAVIGGLSSAKMLMVADNPGSWAIQSLIAERADAGLIGGFRIADMP
jgi:FtsP/CotA-like multicopper oxidase with cupredoxin domain